jgi:hypothetical protein
MRPDFEEKRNFRQKEKKQLMAIEGGGTAVDIRGGDEEESVDTYSDGSTKSAPKPKRVIV